MALTTLILGAGLGKEYGFPDGPELRRLLINELPDHEKDLKRIIQISPAQTVDEIAVRYPAHADKIRRLTVKVIRERENEHALFQNEKPNTYKYMLWQIANAKIKGHSVEIITFNYDRSLPHLVHQVNSVEIEARKIDLGTIRHVYGRLAPLWFEDDNLNRQRKLSYHEYGDRTRTPEGYNAQYWAETCVEDISRASNIFFIGEEKAPMVTDLKSILEKSDQIFFLGVGYHKANMEILGFDFRKKNSKQFVAGTGLGLSQDDIKSLLVEYPSITKIEQCDAHTFLKTKFDISDPLRNGKVSSHSTWEKLGSPES